MKILCYSLSASLAFAPLITPIYAHAAPSGGNVSSGNATINQNGNITNIHQSSNNATIDWNTFNVGQNETVNFIQPNSNSATLNNIHDANPSSILGSINANGQVFLSNPNGFIFGANSSVNVGSFLATTSNMSLGEDNDLTLSIDPDQSTFDGEIINNGSISTADSGYIAFFAPRIENNGQLNSNKGDIVLSNANSGTLFFPNSAGIGFDISSLESVNPLGIENHGEITAAGGRVLLSSDAIEDTLQYAVNNDGLISVTSIESDGGQIKLLASKGSIDQTGTLSASSIENGDGGEVIIIAEKSLNAAGSIDARGGNQSGNGGFVETSGLEHIKIAALVDTRALHGLVGNWLIDPDTLTIVTGGADDYVINNPSASPNDSYLDVTTLTNALMLSDITLEATNLITVDTAITSTANTLTFDTTKLTVNEAINVSSLDFKVDTLEIGANITALDFISFSNTSNTNITSILGNSPLTFQTNTININSNNSITSDDSLTLNTSNLNLNADLATDGQLEISTTTNINVDGTRSITTTGASELSMRNATITGTNSGELTINTGSGNIFLQNIDAQSSLTNLSIVRAADNAELGNINISGDINSGAFSFINNNTWSGATPDEQLFILASNLTFTSTGDVTFDNSRFTGNNSSLSINADQIEIDAVDNISSLTLNSTNTTDAIAGSTLSGDISVRGDGGLAISGADILLAKDVTITATTTSDLIFNSEITGSSKSLTLSVFDGVLELNKVTGILNLNITNSGNQTNIHDAISLVGTFNSENTSQINFAESGGNITAATVSSSATHMQSSSSIQLTATTIDLGEVTSSSFSSTATKLNLHNDITTTGDLDLSKNTGIFLAGHSTLTGALNLGASGSVKGINNIEASTEAFDLAIVLEDQNFILGDVGNVDSLRSFSLTGNGELSLEGTNIIPQTNGTAGVSFLGNLSLSSTTTDLTINTSDSNGAINLSGLNIDAATISLTAGSGDISLGTLGANTEITSLAVDTTGTINLHGNITNKELKFNFSKASSVVLHDNLVFGSESAFLTDFNLGTASVDGNFDLEVHSALFSAGEIGQDIALQNLSINMGAADLTIDDNLNVAGNLTLSANSATLDALISSSGGDINITTLAGVNMSATSEITATDGNITATANTGDIALSQLTALDQVNITATAGNITNAIDDYQSNTNTSTNINAANITLVSGLNSGSSESSPLVLDAGTNGAIDITSGGQIFIANLSNSRVTSNQDIIDNSSLSSTATGDALNQIKSNSFDVAQFDHFDLTDPTWQEDDEQKDGQGKVDRTTSAPRIYYSKKGWRLGNPK